MKKSFICNSCKKEFTPTYNFAKNRIPKYCSRKCNGSTSPLIKKTDGEILQNKCKQIISVNNRYTTAKELAFTLNVSTKTIHKFIKIKNLNKTLGFHKKSSNFEQIVFECLSELFSDLEIIREKTFKGLKSNKNWKLRFDFFLPQLNLIIEADGLQHYQNNHYYFNSNDTKENDIIKNNYCKSNNISIIRVKQCYDKKRILSYIKSQFPR
jgi:very-short-patch-repair endonuclease